MKGYNFTDKFAIKPYKPPLKNSVSKLSSLSDGRLPFTSSEITWAVINYFFKFYQKDWVKY